MIVKCLNFVSNQSEENSLVMVKLYWRHKNAELLEHKYVLYSNLCVQKIKSNKIFVSFHVKMCSGIDILLLWKGFVE